MIRIFLYFFQNHPHYGKRAKEIFRRMTAGEVYAVTSMLTRIVLLSIPMKDSEVSKLTSLFLEIPNLKVLSVHSVIADEAARIRRSYGFRIADAIQLATALYAKADIFVTNDKRLEKYAEISVRIL